jgi:hypothetical protein
MAAKLCEQMLILGGLISHPGTHADYDNYDDFPAHLTDSERGDDTEPLQEDRSVAQLEVEPPRRAARPFYTMKDLEDVDE